MNGAPGKNETPDGASGHPKFPLAAFLLILALAGAIRFYAVFSESLSGDEYYQRLIITQPYLQQIPALRADIVHPPFSYWLGRAVSSVAGYGLFGLRLPAAVFGILAVALTMLLGFRLFKDRRVGLAAGLLVALSDSLIMVSHFARSYSMLSALVLAYVLVLLWAWRDPGRSGPWLLLTGLSLVLAFSHYFAWLYFAALFPFALVAGGRNAFRRWILTLAVTALAVLPWTLYVLPSLRAAGGIATVLAWIETPSLRDFAGLFARFTGPSGSWAWIGAMLAVALVCLVSSARASRRTPEGPQVGKAGRLPADRARWLPWFLALVPPVLLFVLAVPLKQPVWGIRHLVPALPFWALLLTHGASRLAPRRRLVFPAAVLLLAGLQAYASSDVIFQYWFDPFAQVARALKDIGPPTPACPLFATEGRYGQVVGFHLGSQENIYRLPPGNDALPREFFLVYHPHRAGPASRFRGLRRDGYKVVWQKAFIKRPGDYRGLRLVRLVNPAVGRVGYVPPREGKFKKPAGAMDGL